MSLKYNRETSVPRDIKTQFQADTAFLNSDNIVGRETDKQTDSFFEYIIGTNSVTTTEDIILTGVSLTAANPTASGSQTSLAWININTNIIGITTCKSTASQAGNISHYIPLPNWFLPAGTILGCTESGGDDSTATFIGYLA